MKQFNRARLNQPLRRAVQQVQLTRHQRVLGGTGLLEIHGGVEKGSSYPELFQRRHLILHQGDQRGNHNRRARANKCRHLVTQGFTPARWHKHQGVAAFRHFPDDVTLQRPERFVAEDFVQHLFRIPSRGGGALGGKLFEVLIKIHRVTGSST